jgi:hypothetical protein
MQKGQPAEWETILELAPSNKQSQAGTKEQDTMDTIGSLFFVAAFWGFLRGLLTPHF